MSSKDSMLCNMNFRSDTMVSKLILLYMFDKIEIALTEQSIIDICWNRNNWLNYMEIVDILPQLIEMNFISKTKDADGDYLIDIYKKIAKKVKYTALMDWKNMMHLTAPIKRLTPQSDAPSQMAFEDGDIEVEDREEYDLYTPL